MAKKHTARCACGAVKFEFNTDPTFVAVCHCLDCKKSSGGEAATFFGVPAYQRRAEGVSLHRPVGQGPRPELLSAMRRQGIHQQSGGLPGDDLRHARQPR